MTTAPLVSVAAVGLALVHLLAGRLRLPSVPRSAILSASSGVSVAYVFVHLLPEVASTGRALAATGVGAGIESVEWVLALAGLLVFYALELRLQRRRADPSGRTGDRDAWLHLAVNAVYVALVGYLLLEQAEVEDGSLGLFAIAMALHFLVNDHGLRHDHGELYERRGRWLLAGAVLVGHVASLVVQLPATAIGLPLAFLAGSIVLIVLKEELPEGSRSRAVPLLLGAGGYAVLLLAT